MRAVASALPAATPAAWASVRAASTAAVRSACLIPGPDAPEVISVSVSTDVWLIVELVMGPPFLWGRAPEGGCAEVAITSSRLATLSARPWAMASLPR